MMFLSKNLYNTYRYREQQGTRIKRGLFRTSDKKAMNSVVNGALNIIRKIVPTLCCKKHNWKCRMRRIL